MVLGFGMGLPKDDYNPSLENDENNLKALEADK
jgi:hypothetical protein